MVPCFTFTVGNIPVTVQADDLPLLNALRNRYLGFENDRPGGFFVSIQRSEDSHPDEVNSRQIVITPEGALVQGQGYRGKLDRRASLAILEYCDERSLENLDYFLRLVCILLVFWAGGFILHAAGIIRREYAHMFFGPSGSGKTTIARLSPPNTVMNDDLIALLPDQKRWFAHGTPFTNPTQVRPQPLRAPVAGIYRLTQDCITYLEPLRESEATAEILSCVPVIASNTELTYELLRRLVELNKTIPAYRLHFQPDATFWDVIEQAKGQFEPFSLI